MRRLWTLGLAGLCAACIPVATACQPERVVVEEDLTFAKAGAEEIKLDLAWPREGKGPFPAVLCLQGNFWQYGSHKNLAQTIQGLANRGYVAVSVAYRQPPAHPFPAALEDCKAAVRWLREHADKYKIAKDQIGVIGLSGGAHLGYLLALTTKADGLEGTGDLTPGAAAQSSQIQAAVCFSGATDLGAADWGPGARQRIGHFLGKEGGDTLTLARRASPMSYLKPQPSFPAILCFHGNQDPEVPHSQAVQLIEALKRQGAPAILVTMDGEGHGWKGKPLQESLKLTFEFLDERLKK